MITTQNLENLICKNCIIKEFVQMDEAILGYYHSDGIYNVILINECIQSNERLYRCVLSEELGHHKMTVGDTTPRKYMCYRDRLVIDKQELLALRWATDHLIPTDLLLDSIKNWTAPSLTDLVDYFFVTQGFMLQKLEFMAKQSCHWGIDEKRYLYLGNYPNIHIVQGSGMYPYVEGMHSRVAEN